MKLKETNPRGIHVLFLKACKNHQMKSWDHNNFTKIKEKLRKAFQKQFEKHQLKAKVVYLNLTVNQLFIQMDFQV